jgi:hypothetical protein
MPTILCRTEADEREALLDLRQAYISLAEDVALPPRWIGWRIWSFDGPMLETRARLLGLPSFHFDLRKYGSKNVTDLQQVTTFDGSCGVEVMARHQKTIAKRFGIENPDPFDGSMVGEMVREGRWQDIAAHCQADISMTAALYRRLGFTVPGIVCDVETFPIDGVSDYQEFIKIDSRLTDPKKIEAAKEEKYRQAALDPYLARIVCIGYEVVGGPVSLTQPVGAEVAF